MEVFFLYSLFNPILLDDTQNFINQLPSTNQDVFNSVTKGSKQSFQLIPNHDLILLLSALVKYADLIFIVFALIGAGMMVYSIVGTNGEYRRRGGQTMVAAEVALIAMHEFIIGACASGQLGNGKLMIFIVLALCQLIFFVGAPVLYTLGSHWLQLSEMTSTPSLERKAQGSYNAIIFVIVGGIALTLLLGVM